jgi:hypothetical protein
VLLSLVMEFEQSIPLMAKVTIVAGSALVTADMWESQYSVPAAVLMLVIVKC